MLENFDQDHSRMDRFEKKRRDTKLITLFGVIGSLLIVVLIFLFIFNEPPKDEAIQATGNNDSQENTDNTTNQNTEDEGTDEQTDVNNEPTEDGDDSNPTEEQQDAPDEQIQQSSDDPNVIESYVNEAWEPIGTVQEEPHTPSYEKESQDWNEMIQAISYAVEIQPNDMFTWWVTHGETVQHRVATISNKKQDLIYRVTIEWVEGQGYKPVMVERLKENDQKYRFEEDNNENEQETEVE